MNDPTDVYIYDPIFFEMPGLKTEAEAEIEAGVSHFRKKGSHISSTKNRSLFFSFSQGTIIPFFFFYHSYDFFFFRERGMYIIIRLVDLCSLLCCFRVAAYDFIIEKKIALYILFSIYLPYLTPLRVQYI